MVRLIDDEQLERSSVVANSAMNRERGLFGRDGYIRAVGVDPLSVLTDRLAADRSTTVRWLDLCCGSGTALLQAAQHLDEQGVADRVEITGVDLVDFFAEPPPAPVHLATASVTSWQPDQAFDLITCVHGLHYVGDKLAILTAAASWLTAHGLLVASFDAAGIRLPDGTPAGRRLTTAIRSAGFVYDGRRHRIRRDRHTQVRLPFRYLGADPAAGPNYSGQPAVHSYYQPDTEPNALTRAAR